MGISDLRARDLMTSKVITFSENETIAAADIFMMRRGIGSLLIVDDQNNLTGIVTDGDIVRMRNSIQSPDKLVSQLMTRNPITVAPDTPLKKVLKIMLDHDIEHLPVVKERKLVGLITHSRLFKMILKTMEN